MLKEGHVGALGRGHVVDVGEIGIEGGVEAVVAEECCEEEEDNCVYS